MDEYSAGLEYVAQMAAEGASLVLMAGNLGIHAVTFLNYRKRQPEINQAIE